jgi:hypothetical protein
MAGAGKKTFTAGETLTASDVNTYLMEQSVMYFGGTAARASAIPTPSTGMTSYIGVTGTATIPQLETYTGSAWQTPYAMTLLANVTSGTGITSINIDNVFSSAYRNYQIVINGGLTGVVDSLEFRMRDSGGTISTSSYSFMGMEMNSGAIGTITPRGAAATTAVRVGTSGGPTSPATFNAVVQVFAPNLNQPTNITSIGVTNAQGSIATVANWNNGSHFNSTVCTGFAIIQGAGAGTFTSATNIQVYGLRNS